MDHRSRDRHIRLCSFQYKIYGKLLKKLILFQATTGPTAADQPKAYTHENGRDRSRAPVCVRLVSSHDLGHLSSRRTLVLLSCAERRFQKQAGTATPRHVEPWAAPVPEDPHGRPLPHQSCSSGRKDLSPFTLTVSNSPVWRVEKGLCAPVASLPTPPPTHPHTSNCTLPETSLPTPSSYRDASSRFCSVGARSRLAAWISRACAAQRPEVDEVGVAGHGAWKLATP